MEGKSSLSDIMTQEMLSDLQDLQAPVQFHHPSLPPFYQQGSEFQPQSERVFPVDYMQEQAVSFVNDIENEREKSLANDDYSVNTCAVTRVDGHIEVDEEKETPWQRTKWNEKMVKLLITAAYYIKQFAPLGLKLGKWKLVSKLMMERGYHVSPQQCEDKIDSLNKGYKRLNDVLGKGLSCKVVENPELLDMMDISDKAKEVVMRLLSSKQLFYKELCSYHNGNQLFLPYDKDLECSVHLALREKCLPHSKSSKAGDEQDRDAIADGLNNEIVKDTDGMFEFPKVPLMVSEKNNDLRVVEEGDELQKQRMAFRLCQLRSKKFQVKAQLLKLEKQRIKWQRKYSWKSDRELKKMRLQNESLKLENECMATEMMYKQSSAHYNFEA